MNGYIFVLALYCLDRILHAFIRIKTIVLF
jgi:hypothetical protein